ncbi:hypothetical protein INS49_005049 [Diaporthe citri]|uniref:uncharacterized protein n=1 Tax=Diaporthe citri TaxID=83186 RepID=UPI001C7E2C88|nr:uncharacterized protein INS49_005049 [Diaporthe citri]KAG6354078.1 hypothetical protein INS49_005049 [Diaporthe citri]
MTLSHILMFTAHRLSGRYPWATEHAQQAYGDFVRIAPNELLFATSQASIDIYTPHVKNHESFIKSDINDRGDEHGGILFERDPARHRIVAKQLAPAFSSRASMAKEPVMHMYIDAFVDAIGASMAQQTEGIDFSKWCNWLAMDTSADMAYNRKMHEMKDMRNSAYLEVLLGFNAFTTLEQVSKRFPYVSRVIKPALFTYLPKSSLKSIPEMVRTGREEVQRRIRQKGNTEHLDFFEQMVPARDPMPTDPKEMRHLEQVASQLLFAGYEPISSWYYSTLFFLLKDRAACEILAAEVRGAFKSYKGISIQALASLKYLNACLEESLRLFPSNNTGLPRISPGAVVDGKYIPKGVGLPLSHVTNQKDKEEDTVAF